MSRLPANPRREIQNSPDANMSNLAAGDFVSYDGQAFVNTRIDLDTLDDVDATNPVDDSVLSYEGGSVNEWRPKSQEDLRVGGIRTNAGIPDGSPSAGDMYYDIDDSTLYTYDAQRDKWLGPPMCVTVGRAGDIISGYLMVADVVQSASRGIYIPYDVTVVEASYSNDAGAQVVIYFRDTGVNQGSLTNNGGLRKLWTDIDIDLVSQAILGIYLEKTGINTPNDVTFMFVMKRRKT